MRKIPRNLQAISVKNVFFAPVQNWVKNVYSMCVEQWVTRVRSYTGVWRSLNTDTKGSVQHPTFTQFIPSFTPLVYTPKIPLFNLSNAHFYTVSTPPIITKKN